MKKAFLLIPSLGLLTLMGFGCNPLASLQKKVEEKVTQSVAEGIVKNQTGADVDISDNKITYTDPKTGNTSSMGENVSIPDNFPKDLPIYAGTKAVSVTLADAGKSASLSLTSQDEANKIADWYKSQLTGLGFTQDSTMATGQGQIASYKKGNVTVSVIIATGEEQDFKSTIILGRQEETP